MVFLVPCRAGKDNMATFNEDYRQGKLGSYRKVFKGEYGVHLDPRTATSISMNCSMNNLVLLKV